MLCLKKWKFIVINYILFWIAKTLAEALLGILFLLILYACLFLPRIIREWKKKNEDLHSQS